uniref:L1 transposable element RRM domain-containing protein n=1 Tax=Latimeria chalumnae TaxID=7897 RepID=H3AF63_LATCH
ILTAKLVLKDIKTILASIRQISTALVEIKHSNTDILIRLTSIESHLSDSDGRLVAAEAQLTSLTSAVAELRNRLDDQENRACQNNVWILGFPEGVEQGNPTRFLEKTLPTLLKLPAETELSIEWAHCSLAPQPALGQRPHPFIIKLLCFPKKELLLKLAWDLGILDWEGYKILFFPDLSKALQARHRQFLPIKKVLQEKSIKYGLFYLATLKITYKGETLSFATAEE